MSTVSRGSEVGKSSRGSEVGGVRSVSRDNKEGKSGK